MSVELGYKLGCRGILMVLNGRRGIIMSEVGGKEDLEVLGTS